MRLSSRYALAGSGPTPWNPADFPEKAHFLLLGAVPIPFGAAWITIATGKIQIAAEFIIWSRATLLIVTSIGMSFTVHVPVPSSRHVVGQTQTGF